MNTMRFCRAVLACLCLASAPAFSAITVLYSAEDVANTSPGQDLWLYTYVVSGPLALGESVDVEFAYQVHSPLSAESVPAGWVPDVTPSDAALQSNGHFVATNADGQMPATFGVMVERYQAGPLGSQDFTQYDEQFNTLGGGTTVPIPEPQTWALVVGGLALMLGRAARRR